MLDDKILDRARRLIESRFAERRKALPKEVNRVIAEVQKISGTAQCSGTYEGVHTACTREISTRAKIVFDSLLRVHKIYDSPITNMLAIDLKEEISHYIEAIVEEISKYMIQRLPMSKSDAHYFDFENIKREVIERISVKVDLYVDSLLCKPAGTGQDIAPTIFRRIWTGVKGFIKEAYRITIKSFFDSVMNK